MTRHRCTTCGNAHPCGCADLFVLGYETGWNASGEGFNGEYCRPRRPWPEFWAGQLAQAREEKWTALLAAAITTAAALCRAHENAIKAEQHRRCDVGRNATACRFVWAPGCGRPAP